MAETWCARRLTLNLIIIIAITRKVYIKFVYSYTKLHFSVFWIMFFLQIQMQASKTNSQRVLMELWCPQLLFPQSIQWCFMPERSCFDGYGYGVQAQELIQQCCAIYWAVYQAVLFATLPSFAGWQKLILTFAKNCLLTGQEQACTRITWFFVRWFGFHHVENGPKHRKMVVDCPHTLYLSFFLHGQNFWRIKFTQKNANFSR